MGYDIYVNGQRLPAPADIEFLDADIMKEAGRSPETGDLFAKWINSKIRIDVTWKAITEDKLAQIKNILDADKITTGSPFFRLQFEYAGRQYDITAYRGDIKAGLYFIKDGQKIYRDVSISFIER